MDGGKGSSSSVDSKSEDVEMGLLPWSLVWWPQQRSEGKVALALTCLPGSAHLRGGPRATSKDVQSTCVLGCTHSGFKAVPLSTRLHDGWTELARWPCQLLSPTDLCRSIGVGGESMGEGKDLGEGSTSLGGIGCG